MSARVCSFCEGPLGLKGKLGRMVILECRDCGAEYHRKAEDWDEPYEGEQDEQAH